MKNMKLLISLVLVMTMCVAMLAGCSGRPSTSTRTDWENPGLTGSDWEDPGKTDWEDPANPTDPDWEDPGRTDWEDPANPSQPSQPSQPDETGRYRHEIDGIVFYTEHDVEQWIERIPGGRNIFHMDQMVKDLFGDDAVAGNGRAMYYDNRMFAFGNAKLDGNTNDFPTEDYYPYISVDSTYIYDMGNGEKEYYLPIYYFSSDNNKHQGTDYELIEICLYACEQWARNDYYMFENFESSARIMVVNR